MLKVKKGRGAIIGLLFMPLMIGLGHADVPNRNVTVAVFPCPDVVRMLKKFHPMRTYLEETTHFRITLRVPKDSAELEREVKNGDIDFALLDPHIYVKLAHLYKKDLLMGALTREGKPYQCGVIIARKDSGLKSLVNLKGKTVMFGPKLSTVRWLFAKLLFEETGMDIETDLKGYTHGTCCEDAAFNVYLGAADAAVVCEHFLVAHPDKHKELGFKAERFAVIGKTRLAPTRVFAGRRDLDRKIFIPLVHALTGLDRRSEGQNAILLRSELGGFQMAKDSQYDEIRKLINRNLTKGSDEK